MRSVSATRDVSNKPSSLRIARAAARVKVKPATMSALRKGTLPKADPVGVAKVAAIQAAKETSRLVPFCHQVPIDAVTVSVTTGRSWIDVETEVTAIWRTGVEMEALVAASAAALTLYDMLKPVDDSLEIQQIRLTHKAGGTSAAAGRGAGVRAAVLVLSDSISAGRARDVSGKILVKGLRGHRASVPVYRVLSDDRALIERALRTICDGRTGRGIDLVLATGGTGVGPRDVTAEAVAGVIDRRLHGVEAAFLGHGQERFPGAMLSRCVAGTRKRTLIVALPGSPAAAEDAMNVLFPALFHAIPVMKGTPHRPRGAGGGR
jgi:cyclic pyranopterin phosphate synthase